MATHADLAAILRDAARSEGEGVLDDRARLGALLRERAPSEARAIHLLLTALDAGVPTRLRAGDGEKGGGEIGQQISQEAGQLVDHFGVAPELARQAVETWAMALGRLPGVGEAATPEPSTERNDAEERPEAVFRSTQDGSASSATSAHRAPQDDEVEKGGPAGLPGLPPLPTEAAGHRDSVLASPGSEPARAEVNADLRPILPRPPDLPVPSPPSTGPVTRDAGGVAPALTELPPVRSLPPVQPLPPVGALPPVQALPEVRPLPSAASSKPMPEVRPLPPVRPLPSAAPPVKPLPGVRPLPPGGAAPPVQPPSPPQPAAPPPANRPGWIAWAGGGIALVALGAGLLALFGNEPKEPTKPADPPPRTAQGPGAPQSPQAPQPPRIPQSPAQTGGQTAEGFPIVDAQTEPDVQGRRLEGDPNTLLFAFGLRFGQETYTYQAAADFTRGDANGAGLVKVFKGGRESATGELRTSRSIQSNGYLGFTMSGSMRGEVSAPDVCVSALVGKTPGRFDLANGGGLFCAFATKPGGVCDGDVKIGCGKLMP